jgi:hypothetical protein
MPGQEGEEVAQRRDDYARCVGDAFNASEPPTSEWTLRSVSELTRHGEFESYSIEFEHAGASGDQGTVTLEHPELGTVELFVVAIGPDRYEAVFNNVIGSPS